VLFAVALVVRLGLLLVWYTPGFENFDKGDFESYREGAEWLASHGDFSGRAFFARPPLFPLLVHALGGHALAILVVNAVLGALVAPIASALALRLGLGRWSARFAGVIAALDPGTVRYSTFLGPEALANVTLAGSLLALVAAMDGRATVRNALVAGFLHVASTLTRPATFLLAGALTASGVWLRPRRGAAFALFATVALLGSAAWIIHNGLVFGRYSISSVGPYTLLYYRAASLEHLSTGRPVDDVYAEFAARVEERIGGDPRADPDRARLAHQFGGTETQAAMLEIAADVIRRHPFLYVATLPLGVVRMFGLVTPTVEVPNASEALLIVWNAALFFASGAGLWWARRENPRLFWLVSCVTAYYVAVTLAVETSALDTRMRSMLTPLMAIAAVYAVDAKRERRSG
jgi:hypothetical protein